MHINNAIKNIIMTHKRLKLSLRAFHTDLFCGGCVPHAQQQKCVGRNRSQVIAHWEIIFKPKRLL